MNIQTKIKLDQAGYYTGKNKPVSQMVLDIPTSTSNNNFYEQGQRLGFKPVAGWLGRTMSGDRSNYKDY